MCVCVIILFFFFFLLSGGPAAAALSTTIIVKITVRSFSSVRTSQYRCLYVSDENPFQKNIFHSFVPNNPPYMPLSVNTVFRMVQLYCRCICTKFSYMYKTLVRSYYIIQFSNENTVVESRCVVDNGRLLTECELEWNSVCKRRQSENWFDLALVRSVGGRRDAFVGWVGVCCRLCCALYLYAANVESMVVFVWVCFLSLCSCICIHFSLRLSCNLVSRRPASSIRSRLLLLNTHTHCMLGRL